MNPEQMRARRDELIAAAKAVNEKAKAEKRDLTTDEQQEIGGKLTEVKTINEAMRASEVLGQLDGLARSGKARSAIDDGRRLNFGSKMASQAAANLMTRPDGSKALAPSGAAVVGVDWQSDPIALGRPATGLLDVLPVVQHDSPVFSYMRQGFSGRTNNAAVVAENAVKPTSVFSLERVDSNLVVVAHLSELIPRYYLIDAPAVATWLEGELGFGLAVGVEAKVLADINAQSGIQTQAYATSPLVTIRSALTKLEAAGLVASSIVIHPVAWQNLELSLTTTNAVEHLALPYDPAAKRLFGVPLVVTNSQAAAVAHVLAVDAVSVETDTLGVQIDYSENSTGDSFSRNQIQARCEGRFQTAVRRPYGVVKCALA